jgi:hypothetical protein
MGGRERGGSQAHQSMRPASGSCASRRNSACRGRLLRRYRRSCTPRSLSKGTLVTDRSHRSCGQSRRGSKGKWHQRWRPGWSGTTRSHMPVTRPLGLPACLPLLSLQTHTRATIPGQLMKWKVTGSFAMPKTLFASSSLLSKVTWIDCWSKGFGISELNMGVKWGIAVGHVVA